MRLMWEIDSGHDQEVQELIRAGASVTAKNNMNRTALHKASSSGGDHSDVAKALIEAGADVNGQDEDGATPLIEAAYMGNEQVVHELIGAGASVTAKNNKQQTALHSASSSSWGDHSSVVKALIEAGAGVNEQDKDGTTPLMQASCIGHDQVVHELIRAGASVTAKNNAQQTALQIAICNSRDLSSVVKTLIEAGCDVNEQDEDGAKPLIEAAYKGHDQVVHELIRAGASVTAKNNKQQTALHIATWEGHFSVVKTLIEAGADVSEQDEDGATPLMVAAEKGHDQVVLELIRAGASVTAKNSKQQNALHIAICRDHISVVKTLIVAGADVNGQDEDGTTCLMLAVKYWQLNGDGAKWYMWECGQVVYQLIRAGASVTTKNNKQQTVLHIATWLGHSSVVKTLIEAGADVNEQDEDGATPLMVAVRRWQLNRDGGKWYVCEWGQVVHELIRAGASVTAKNNKQQTALHIATRLGHSSVVRTLIMALIEAGADVNEQDEDGATPLIWAVEHWQLKRDESKWYMCVWDQVVHELIRAGASMTVLKKEQKQRVLHYVNRNTADTTLLMDAAQMGYGQVVHMLIIAGANVNAISRRHTKSCYFGSVAAGSTAMHFAAVSNSIACGGLLVEAGADMTARNNDSKSPLDLASVDFRQSIRQTQHFSTKRIVAVIGNSEHGKSTLITALKAEGKTLLKRFTNMFAKVQDIIQRTTGIEAVQFSSQGMERHCSMTSLVNLITMALISPSWRPC